MERINLAKGQYFVYQSKLYVINKTNGDVRHFVCKNCNGTAVEDANGVHEVNI